MKDPVQNYFDREASHYTEHFIPRKSGRAVLFQTRLALARELGQGFSGRLLDCAAGTGEISAAIYASGQFSDATFVDISAEMLQRARSRLGPGVRGNLHFVQTDIFSYLAGLDATAKFDLIVCLGLIAHTGQLERLLRSLGEHLADGGRILLQTSLQDHWGNYVWRLLLDRPATRRHGYAFSYYTRRQITEAVEHAQLSILSLRRYGVGLPFLEKVAPWANYQFEAIFSSWASRNGAEVIYGLGKPGEAGDEEPSAD